MTTKAFLVKLWSLKEDVDHVTFDDPLQAMNAAQILCLIADKVRARSPATFRKKR